MCSMCDKTLMPRKSASILRCSPVVQRRVKVAIPLLGKKDDGKNHDQHTTADLLLTEAMDARRIPTPATPEVAK